MSEPEPPFSPVGDDVFAIHLSAPERDLLRTLAGQLTELLADPDPIGDPAVARLFPAAYPDDLLRNLDFEREAGASLAADRREAVETLDRTAGAERISRDDLLAWLATINGLRIVLGTRLAITEEVADADIPDDHPQHEAFSIYRYLTWLEASIIDVLPVD